MEKLKLKEINYYLACDLKLINSLLGISSHSGKFACPYCDGQMTLESGNLRTFSSLAENYSKFDNDGKNVRNMQKYANVIHECLLAGEPNQTILSAIPLPELHLLMGMVNWALELLYKVVPKNELQQLMRKKGKSVHGYHGGGLDGGNSNLFLKHLEFLSERTSNNVAPIFEMLMKFKVVVDGCFSLDLSNNYQQDIDDFISSVQSLISYSKEYLNLTLNPTWKVHILVTHLKLFLDEKKVGLGIYCEQTSEAAHSILKPTIRRFKRKADHDLHGPKLMCAASSFSSQNM